MAYPHGAAAPAVKALRERGLKVVDLSADFRLDRERYERWYQQHEAPELLDEAVYGLTEAHREEIRGADLVAAPGCYSTAALLALWPLREHIDDVVVDAKSGVSGAGREATQTTHFVSVTENVQAYKVEGHRHAAELEQELPDGDPLHVRAAPRPDRAGPARQLLRDDRARARRRARPVSRAPTRTSPSSTSPTSRRAPTTCARPTAAAST